MMMVLYQDQLKQQLRKKKDLAARGNSNQQYQ
jgi:hypothetical protein